MIPITRARALEVAQNSIMFTMNKSREQMDTMKASPYKKDLIHLIEKVEAEYAELAAALNFIENLARQKELL